jgi:hypothetical protein
MTDQPQTRGPSDAADYSSTKAPETRREAEERVPAPTDDPERELREVYKKA